MHYSMNILFIQKIILFHVIVHTQENVTYNALFITEILLTLRFFNRKVKGYHYIDMSKYSEKCVSNNKINC